MKFAAVLLAFLLLTATAFAQVDTAAQKKILELLNRERTERQLAPLQFDAQLTEAAQKHTALMAQRHTISHQFYEEPAMAARVVAAGVHFDLVGENVASSQDAASAHDALMMSPPHRANILNGGFTQVGIGALRDEHGELFITEDFAHKVEEYTAAQAETRVLGFISNLRRSAHKKRLVVVEHPELRILACEMAHDDFISMAKVRTLPGVSTTVVFTTADISSAPKPLSRFRDAPGKTLGIGVCYAPSASEIIPVYWAVVVTYF